MSAGWSRLTKADLKGFDKEIRVLILEVMELGGDGRRTQNGHIQVRLNGTLLVFGGTASDRRALLNARSAVKRALRG